MIMIKVCGLTRREDINFALELGVSAFGFILADSPRQVSLTVVEKLTANLPPFISRVAVVVNPDSGELARIIESNLFDYIQFHGREDPGLLCGLPVKTIKAVSISTARDLEQLGDYSSADYFLFDTRISRRTGGTGQSFDWNLLNQAKLTKPFILSGGLGPDNILSALRAVRPAAVDLNSRVEESPGIKNHNLLQETVGKIRNYHHGLKQDTISGEEE